MKPKTRPATMGKPATTRRGVVALIEDDTEFRSIVSRWLQPEFDTISFDDGEPFLSSDEEFAPDLIVMDVKLPGLNGYSVCRRIHEQRRFAGVPVLFLTGVDSDEGFLLGLDAGGAFLYDEAGRSQGSSGEGAGARRLPDEQQSIKNII